jgi:hypothetical protein
MSMYYSPELVKSIMKERLSEAHERNLLHCCEEIDPVAPKSSALQTALNMFRRRQSPASCAC